MGDIKWIKLSTGMFEDEAIQVILSMPDGSTLLEIWLRLLISAGKINNNGLIYFKENIPYTEDMLATVFNKETNIIKYALTTFSKFGLIEILDNNQILIKNWEKHQNIEGMEKIKEQNRIRKQRQRDREKLLLTDKNNMSRDMSRDVTQQNKNKNKNIEKDIDIDVDIEEEKEKKEENKFSSTPTTPLPILNLPSSEGEIEVYGTYLNVCMTAAQYNRLLGICTSKKLLDETINSLSEKIETGEEKPFKVNLPNAHYIRVVKYIDFRRKNPDKFRQAEETKSTAAEVINKWYDEMKGRGYGS